MATKLQISNPRRILLVGTPDSDQLVFLKTLTGTLPALTTDFPAGASHTLHIQTAYYDATVPIWIDEITPSAEDEWASGYLAPEAKEVLKALGGFIITFLRPQDEAGLEAIKKLLAALQRVVRACGYAWDGVCLAVAMPQSLRPVLEKPVDDWEDLCREYGFEYVDYEFKGRNDYGEPAGMERVHEALEANDWGGDDDDAASFGSFEDGEEGVDPLKLVGDEMEREMFGLHSAIFPDEDGEGEDEDEELQVEKLEAMMMRMAALKGIALPPPNMGEEVSKEERRKIAAKAIADVMKSA
ncbi:uncharacterized protein H6S33_011265 [Morchella sextelata]|uniref:uncharacterized protein n=1 Tax=Morchella sextelata TaxID=1174677 RepID=UPI001D04C3AE|nr:uncharacterized protein H6S33_011265 [Morchella sextelata]KAH0610838.1 hypothetical protein H6S33_011265 [Morchella sextelata]